ncbi:MAG TPA: zinc ribbon domain-containing protein [Candidatus Bathyarchaeia archaeon]|nr:zinc ribbon domain-containing protein [Candidatus Bathyarchaeia archaeon]
MPKEEEKHCIFCSTLIRDGDIFCSNCGANVNERPIISESNQSQTESFVEPLGQTIHSEEKEESNVRILSERPLTSEPIEIQRFTNEPIGSSIVVVPTRVPSGSSENNSAAIVSIVFTVISAILFAIPCPCVGMFAGIPCSVIAFILAIIGLINPNRRVLSISAFIISLLAPVIWFIQFWFLWW